MQPGRLAPSALGDVLHLGPDRSGQTRPIANRVTRKSTMKVLLWIVLIIFLIGLAVVFGLGSLIF